MPFNVRASTYSLTRPATEGPGYVGLRPGPVPGRRESPFDVGR